MKISVITPSIRPKYLNIAQECLEKQTFQDFEWLVEVDLRNRDGWLLPSAWNKLLRRVKGDIIVMYQDCIRIEPDFLENIVELDHNKKAYTYPLGKVKHFEEEPRWDWRNYFENREIQSHQWEIDLASAPRSLFFDVGGFDEEFSKGWSWENCEIAYRAEQAGYKFFVENTIKGVALDHDSTDEHPFRNKLPNNDRRANETRVKAINGDWKLDYLI